MRADDRAGRWHEVWERRRLACLLQEEIEPHRAALPPEALPILEEARALAAVADPGVHAAADVDRMVDRVNALEGQAPLLLHGPVCNGLTMLRCAAQELISACAARPPAPLGAVGRPPPGAPLGRGRRFDWCLVVGGGEELVELAEECGAALGRQLEVRTAGTTEQALERLARRDGVGLVLVNLTLPSGAGAGPHGLGVAAEARRRRHVVLLVTAAGDYLHYWSRLAAAGLTGHDVVIKTQRDFGARLRQRVLDLARPAPIAVSFDEDAGHVVWIAGVEVTRLEAQEALVLRVLDERWQAPDGIADACSETDLAPKPGSVPPLISTLRQKLADAMIDAESENAQDVVIETRRREGLPSQYRLAPWLRRELAPERAGPPDRPPAVLVIEDDPDWALWVTSWLQDFGWSALAVETGAEVDRALASGESPILVADLSLRDPVSSAADPEIGLRLVEDVASRHPGTRVIVLSAFGGRDGVRARLFEAGVRTIDVIDKSAGREECGAVLVTSLQRAADEVSRGVRRAETKAPAHRVHRAERSRIEVDGVPVALSPREADVLDVLFARPNQSVRAELLEYECFPAQQRPHGGRRYNHLNKVQLTIRRLRQKIDRAAGSGVGEAVIRTPRRGAVTTYELHGLVTDRPPA